MKRRIVLGTLILVGALSIAVAAQRGGAPAEGPRVVELDKISDTLYVAKGGGGNTAVFLTAGGVVLGRGPLHHAHGRPVEAVGELPAERRFLFFR